MKTLPELVGLTFCWLTGHDYEYSDKTKESRCTVCGKKWGYGF